MTKEERLYELVKEMLAYLYSIMMLTDDGEIKRETDKFESKLKDLDLKEEIKVDHLIKRLEDVIKELPACYKSINEWWFDFWPDFSWNGKEFSEEVRTLLNDKRIEDLEKSFKECYNQSLKAILKREIGTR